MKRSHAACEGMCGLDKLWADVREEHPKCSRNRVYSIQKEHGLYSVRKKPFKVITTDSNHKLPVAKNLLNQNFSVEKPNAVYGLQISHSLTPWKGRYIWHNEGHFSQRDSRMGFCRTYADGALPQCLKKRSEEASAAQGFNSPL
jgi:hypothetical protein